MRPETLLLFALLSLAASLTFAYLAYRVWRGRRPEPAPPEMQPEPPPAPLPGPAPAADPGLASTAPAPSMPPPALPPAPPSTTPAVRPAPPAAAPPPRTIPVAWLLRDEVSGDLVVRIDDREYRRAQDLLASADRARMEFTLAELNRWFGGGPADEAAREAAGRRVSTRPPSMVEQINEILERKLVELRGANPGIRMVESPGGPVRVYIGVESYESIDAVPDEQIRGLIREAVAEWEAGG